MLQMMDLSEEIDVGVKPQREHFWGKVFLHRKFAVMLEALQNHVHLNSSKQKQAFEDKMGFFLIFPTRFELYKFYYVERARTHHC